MTYRICLLPGDGIGPEVIACAKDVLNALPITWDFTECGIGFEEYQRSGSPLPDSTLQAIRHADATLFGAVTTPPAIPNYFSPVVRMRQSLDLYANLRPTRSIPHESSRPNIDILIVRENTEGLYSGIERLEEDGNRAITERVITRKGSERIIRKAFDMARQTNRRSVHVVHKANVLRQTCGLFRSVAFEIAQEYPDIECEERIIDNMCMQLVKYPQAYDVIATTNLFGDILSDLVAGLVGGLGIVPGANMGTEYAVFEAVHGSAPDIAGQNKANPTALLQSGIMMLRHLSQNEAADRIEKAMFSTLASKDLCTGDLGGKNSTTGFTKELINRL